MKCGPSYEEYPKFNRHPFWLAKMRRAQSVRALSLACLLLSGWAALFAGALEDYVRKPDATFTWKVAEKRQIGEYSVTRLDLTSQTWHELVWKHALQIASPKTVRHPELALLVITGDGDGSKSFNIMQTVAARAGIVTAVLANVPNQPIFDGRREDAIIAYTFDKYLKTGDGTWPLLLPMVKSAVRAMDAVQARSESVV